MAGFAKTFGCSLEYALYEISYVNVNLYLSTLPSYSTKSGGGKSEEKVIDADDPDNRRAVDSILFGD